MVANSQPIGNRSAIKKTKPANARFKDFSPVELIFVRHQGRSLVMSGFFSRVGLVLLPHLVYLHDAAHDAVVKEVRFVIHQPVNVGPLFFWYVAECIFLVAEAGCRTHRFIRPMELLPEASHSF